MKLSSKTRLSFLVLILLVGAVGVYATTISPSGVYDTPWGNFTVGVKTPKITLNGVSRTSWITSEVPEISDYVITGSGGTYIVYDTSGTNYTTNSFSNAGNWVMGNLTGTRRQTVYFRGTFSLTTAPISIPDWVTLDGYAATIDLAANIDAVFVSEGYLAENQRSDYVIIRGFDMDGNKASRTTGTGIKGCFFNGQFYDLRIDRFSDYGIDIESYDGTNRGKVEIYQCEIGSGPTGQGNEMGGVKLSDNGYNTADSWIYACRIQNNGNWQIIIENGATHRIGPTNHFAGWADAGSDECGGIYIGPWEDSTSPDVDKIQIYDNHAENLQKQFVYVNASTGAFSDAIMITNNNVYDCGRSGTQTIVGLIQVNSTGTGRSRGGIIMGNTFHSEQVQKPKYVFCLGGAATDDYVVLGNVYWAGAYDGASWYVDDGGGTSDIDHNVEVT